MRDGALLELIMQRYITPFRDRRMIFRFTCYCNQTKSRKANYVEIIAKHGKDETMSRWDYRDEGLTPLYKCYNGLQEFERTAKKIIHMMNIVLHSALHDIGVWVPDNGTAAGLHKAPGAGPEVLAHRSALLRARHRHLQHDLLHRTRFRHLARCRWRT